MLATHVSDVLVVDQKRKGRALQRLRSSRTKPFTAGGRRPSADGQPAKRSRGALHVCNARTGGWAGDLRDPWREEERRQALLKYVREVQPQSVVQFAEQTHPAVVQAMRQTVLNIVGSLPPQYFDVRISAVAESLAQLMLSIMTTGYMLRSAQFRMELQNSLKQLPSHSTASASSSPRAASSASAGATIPAVSSAAPTAAPALDTISGPEALVAAVAAAAAAASAGATASTTATSSSGPGPGFLYDGHGSEYAPGVQKKNVMGEVLRWHVARGEVERVAAADYIDMLEREVAALRAQQQQQQLKAVPMPFPPAPSAPLATTPGGVEVLGPDPSSPFSASAPVNATYVSPLPGFGERVGVAAAAASAAAPATMGSGGVPLVVGSPLGLPHNELLDYLHALQSGGGGFKELACSPSASSGQAVKEAMELFVARLMGTVDPDALSKLNSEFSAVELSKVLFWLMAVGYTLKSIEARLEVEDGMGLGHGGGGGGSTGPDGNSGGGGGGAGSGGSGPRPGRNDSGGNGGKPEKKGGFGFGGLRGLLPGF